MIIGLGKELVFLNTMLNIFYAYSESVLLPNPAIDQFRTYPHL